MTVASNRGVCIFASNGQGAQRLLGFICYTQIKPENLVEKLGEVWLSLILPMPVV